MHAACRANNCGLDQYVLNPSIWDSWHWRG